MSTSTRVPARTVLAVALVSGGLLASGAAADAAPRGKTRAPSYGVERVGDAFASSDGSSRFGTSALGIADSGVVLAGRSDGSRYLGRPTRTRDLAPVGDAAPYGVHAPVLSPSGTPYAGGYQALVRWTARGVEPARLVEGEESRFYSIGLGGANDAGVVTGCSSYVKVGWPFIGSFRDGVRTMTWPKDFGTCSSGGISRAGVAVITQEHPGFRTHNLVYPRAATMTTAGIRYLKAPAGIGTSADAISPNGKYIVGQTYLDESPTGVARLSATRNPAPLRGAGDMRPVAVTDTGVVVGVENGRAVSWANGRKTDLTSVSRLPRGWVLTDVAGINPKGQIAATATVGGRESVAVRLTPRR